MSVGLYLYVGPYVKAELPEDTSWYDALGGSENLTAHQSDESSQIYFFAPNVPRDGKPERHMTYERHRDNEPLEIDAAIIATETRWFREAYLSAIERVMDHARNATVGWGVVPYWY